MILKVYYIFCSFYLSIIVRSVDIFLLLLIEIISQVYSFPLRFCGTILKCLKFNDEVNHPKNSHHDALRKFYY